MRIAMRENTLGNQRRIVARKFVPDTFKDHQFGAGLGWSAPGTQPDRHFSFEIAEGGGAALARLEIRPVRR